MSPFKMLCGLTLAALQLGMAPKGGPGGGPTPKPASGDDAKCAGTPKPGPHHVCLQDCGSPVAQKDAPEAAWRWHTAAQAQSRHKHGCPVCLPLGTRIATPAGPVKVEDVGVGMPVWTQDPRGRRVVARVASIGGVAHAPVGHQLVRLHLADGRQVTASPGHLSAAGAPLGALSIGEKVDGSAILTRELLPYGGQPTFDLRPAGPTGLYWADEVLIGTTLRPVAPVGASLRRGER